MRKGLCDPRAARRGGLQRNIYIASVKFAKREAEKATTIHSPTDTLNCLNPKGLRE